MFTFENTDPRFDKQIDVHGQHLRRIVQVVADLVGKPLESLRIADLDPDARWEGFEVSIGSDARDHGGTNVEPGLSCSAE